MISLPLMCTAFAKCYALRKLKARSYRFMAVVRFENVTLMVDERMKWERVADAG